MHKLWLSTPNIVPNYVRLNDKGGMLDLPVQPELCTTFTTRF